MTEHIKRCFDAFGPRRCYWGTDLTNSLAKATYRQRITHFTEELPFLSEDDKDWVMGKAIMARLNWDVGFAWRAADANDAHRTAATVVKLGHTGLRWLSSSGAARHRVASGRFQVPRDAAVWPALFKAADRQCSARPCRSRLIAKA